MHGSVRGGAGRHRSKPRQALDRKKRQCISQEIRILRRPLTGEDHLSGMQA